MQYEDVYSDSEEDAEHSSQKNDGRKSASLRAVEPSINDYVIVKCSGKKMVQYFLAIIESYDKGCDEYKVTFLKKTGNSKFCLPEGQDRKQYDIEGTDICEVLCQPVSFHRNQYTFDFDFSRYNM